MIADVTAPAMMNDEITFENMQPRLTRHGEIFFRIHASTTFTTLKVHSSP